MKEMPVEEIVEAVAGQLLWGDPGYSVKGVSIDSRTINPGELFIAIVGERLDGHDFIPAALSRGASSLLVDREIGNDITGLKPDTGVILVDDTTTALQRLAHFYRQKFNDLKVVGVTGSAGKTTTKDMIASLLQLCYRVKKTRGNYNNYYGLPLTLLEMSGQEDYAVLEMGMSSLGEIELLSRIACPQIGVITNVGQTHLEGLGSVENVARGKGELIRSLPEKGLAVLNYDNSYVREMAEFFPGEKIIYYGLEPGADLRAEEIMTRPDGKTSFRLSYQGESLVIKLNKPGKHNVYNALAAIAVAREAGIAWPEISNALERLELSSLRWEEEHLSDGVVLINDTYNANPLSMEAAIETALNISQGRTVAILGGMLELGERSEPAHLELGSFIYRQGVDILITTGEIGQLIARGALKEGMSPRTVFIREGNQEAAETVQELLQPNDTILIKGSRGFKMEEIVRELLDRRR